MLSLFIKYIAPKWTESFFLSAKTETLPLYLLLLCYILESQTIWDWETARSVFLECAATVNIHREITVHSLDSHTVKHTQPTSWCPPGRTIVWQISHH